MAHSNLKRFVLFRKTPVSKALFILCGLSTLWGFYLHPPNEAIRDSALLCCSSSGGLLHWRRVYEGGRLGKKELYWGGYGVVCVCICVRDEGVRVRERIRITIMVREFSLPVWHDVEWPWGLHLYIYI